MKDAPLTYPTLVDRAAEFFSQHGTIDLVDLADADALGITVDQFTHDVSAYADDYANTM